MEVKLFQKLGEHADGQIEPFEEIQHPVHNIHLNYMQRFVEIVALSAAFVSTLVTELYATEWKFSLDWLMIKPLLPYPLFYIFVRLLSLIRRLDQRRVQKFANIVAVLMLVFTAFIYIDAIFVHTSSTSALVFLFAPFYILSGSILLLILLLGVAWLRSKS